MNVDIGPALGAVERALNALDTKGAGQGRSRRAAMAVVNFDGTDCSTVAELAAANRKSELGAAVFALQHKSAVPVELYRDAVRYVKMLHPSPPSNSDGVAVVFTFDYDTARQLAIQDGEPAGELHITLGYFGDVRNFHSMRGMLIGTALTASELKPFTVKLNGITRFTGEGEDALVVNADSPVLGHAYRMLHEHLKSQGIATASEHGYTPHMTLGYLDHDDVMPIQRWLPVEVRINTVALWFGKERIGFRLDEDHHAYLNEMSTMKDSDFPNRHLDPDPGTANEVKDVHGGQYPGPGGNRTVVSQSRKKRRREIIERARSLPLRKVVKKS